MKEGPRVRSPRSAGRVRKPARKLKIIHGKPSRRAAASAKPQPDELYDLAPVGFYTVDRIGRILELNQKGAWLLGFSARWLSGKSFVVFVARQHVQQFMDFLKQSTPGKEPAPIEVDLYVGDRTLPVQLSILSEGADRNSIRHRLSVVDLTNFRRTEELLQQSLANWYSLVHNAPDTIMTVDSRGRIEFVNRPVWGYSTGALVGTSLVDHIPPAYRSQILGCLSKSFRFNRRTTCEVTGIPGDTSRWYNFSFGSPHPSNPSESPKTTTTTTLMIREISESKRTEEDLRTSGARLRDFAARLDAVREEERTRVAREIHDELGQALTALKLDLSWVEGKTKEKKEIRERMKAMIAHVDETIERVRRIAAELRPAILDDLGLIPAIEWQVTEFRKRTGIRTELLSQTADLSLPQEASVAVFRVVQEALTNVIRHARASRVRIRLVATPRRFRIAIEDNGNGMMRGQERGLQSLGIVGMKERISRLGGEFNILSEPGKGTRLDIVIPIKHD